MPSANFVIDNLHGQNVVVNFYVKLGKDFTNTHKMYVTIDALTLKVDQTQTLLLPQNVKNLNDCFMNYETTYLNHILRYEKCKVLKFIIKGKLESGE